MIDSCRNCHENGGIDQWDVNVVEFAVVGQRESERDREIEREEKSRRMRQLADGRWPVFGCFPLVSLDRSSLKKGNLEVKYFLIGEAKVP